MGKKSGTKIKTGSHPAPTPQIQAVPDIIDTNETVVPDSIFTQLEFPLLVLILILIYILSFALRLHSIFLYESMIHEFDPWFNFRTTQILATEGFYNFINLFDVYSWYPLGRVVGASIYPGLMMTATAVYHTLNGLNFTVSLTDVCVLLAPWMASNTSLVTFFHVSDVYNKRAGVLAAAFIGIVPAYIQRSCAGSYDNEGVAIFALIITFAFWTKAVQRGTIGWAVGTVLCYFYMVASWGGYVFITNMIPFHTLVLILSGKYTSKLYVAYSVWYILGTLLATQIPFVNFNALTSSEHFASLGIFGLIQVVGFAYFLWNSGLVSEANKPQLKSMMLASLFALAGLGAFVAYLAQLLGWITPWTGRFWSMFDPTYGKKYIPIIASVAEHQPIIWTSWYLDLNFLILSFLPGIYLCFQKNTTSSIFLICYGTLMIYLSSVMNRLMLVIGPIACFLGGITISELLDHACLGLTKALAQQTNESAKEKEKEKEKEKPAAAAQRNPFPFEVAITVIIAVGFILLKFAGHCNWAAQAMYSSPSIVIQAQMGGQTVLIDDYREAYHWLRYNTPENATVMSWWDYGYQITGMSDRTTLADGNTWNNTHIAQIGKCMASPEEVCYPILKRMGVDYIMVIFGGALGYSGDDIMKFIWMIRISGNVDPTVPKEEEFFTSRGIGVGEAATETMKKSMMYKMAYHRFNEMGMDTQGIAYDRVRRMQVRDPTVLTSIEEVFTSEKWIVRIFKVKDDPNHYNHILSPPSSRKA